MGMGLLCYSATTTNKQKHGDFVVKAVFQKTSVDGIAEAGPEAGRMARVLPGNQERWTGGLNRTALYKGQSTC